MKVLVIKKRVLTSNLCGGVPFQYSYTCSIGQLKLLKGNSTEDVSLGIFWDFQNSSSANIPWKMSEVMFFTSVWILYSNPAALKKWLVTLKNDLYTTEILLVNFQLF